MNTDHTTTNDNTEPAPPTPQDMIQLHKRGLVRAKLRLAKQRQAELLDALDKAKAEGGARRRLLTGLGTATYAIHQLEAQLDKLIA